MELTIRSSQIFSYLVLFLKKIMLELWNASDWLSSIIILRFFRFFFEAPQVVLPFSTFLGAPQVVLPKTKFWTSSWSCGNITNVMWKTVRFISFLLPSATLHARPSALPPRPAAASSLSPIVAPLSLPLTVASLPFPRSSLLRRRWGG
jgi:hypothetical protein